MSNKYTPLFVSERIREWYHNILSHRFKDSKQHQMEVQELIKNMEPDDKVISYYSLVSYKHELTFDNSSVDMQVLERISTNSSTDTALQILVYDYAGQAAFYKDKYIDAISFYKKAENLFNDTQSEFEQADFYKRLGILHYRTRQFVTATHYLLKAKNIFSKDTFFKLNELSCKIVLADIMSESYDYINAELQYKQILGETALVPELKPYCLQAIGLHYQKIRSFDKAISHYTELLALDDVKPYIQAQVKIDLGYAYYQYEEKNRANVLIADGLELAASMDDLAYTCRANSIQLLYQVDDLNTLDEALKAQFEILSESQLFFVASELALDIAYFYKRTANYKKALTYTELSNQYKVVVITIPEQEVTI